MMPPPPAIYARELITGVFIVSREVLMEISFKPDDLKNISDFDISPHVSKLLAAKGITKLFPIQSAAFEAILKGQDMIGRGTFCRFQ